MKHDPFAAALNAISNASRLPVNEALIGAMLASGDGHGSHVRALFGDCALETLERLCAATGVSPPQLLRAYGTARRLHAAANAELDELAQGAGQAGAAG